MARIPYLDLATAPESVKRMIAPDRPNNIALLFGHAETNWPRLADLLLSILGEQSLANELREIAILRVAGLRQAQFEWDQHVAISKAAGVSLEQIDAIAGGDIEAGCFSELEKLVLEAATQLVREGLVDEALVSKLADHLSHREVVELFVASGIYEAVAKLMNILELDPQESMTSDFADAVNRGAVDPS
ncbi:MAG: carboxymuconolactone decarboxylase family protein [Deltaproteobacteria bacterium]|nr:carboxymuconolactone decarboxylase family protein [Deltaproteobacteria bacterium]